MGLHKLFLVGVLAMALSGCGNSGPAPPVDPGLVATLEHVRGSIATSTGYTPDSIEVLASPAHLRISISDSRLAQADQTTRETTATDVLAAAEKTMGADPRLASIQQVSVAIIHPDAEGSRGGSHTEDVIEFRKGPGQRFAKHIS